MTSKTTFYEFLVRGDADGKVAGTHVVYRKVLTEDDGDTHEKILPAQEVSVTDKDKLAEIAGEINTASLATIESLRTEVKDLEGARDAAEEALRKIASYLGVGGYNAPAIDVDAFCEKIIWGINDHASMMKVLAKDGVSTAQTP